MKHKPDAAFRENFDPTVCLLPVSHHEQTNSSAVTSLPGPSALFLHRLRQIILLPQTGSRPETQRPMKIM